MTNQTTDEAAVDIVRALVLGADEIGFLRAQLTAATRRAEQAERMLAKENLIERTAISAFLKHEAESRSLSQCTGRVALIAAAYAVAGEQHSSFKTMCIGCDMPIADKEYVVDCNGETGCPSCFTDDGSGECWFDTIRSAASGEQG